MFILDFLITVPLALYTYLVFPDTPHNTQAFYLTHAERELAIHRINKPTHVHGSISKATFTRIFSTWHIYGFCFIWTMGANCEMFSTNAIMNLYLKSLGTFSVIEVNYLPAAVSGVGIVATLVLGWYSDFTSRSWHVGFLTSCTAIVAGAIMLNPPNFAAKMFALYLNGCQWANQTVMFAWANRLLRDDDVKRSFILATMNTTAVIFYSFWAITFYAADQGPMWREGSIAMIVSGCCMGAGVGVVKLLENRDRIFAQRQIEDFSETNSVKWYNSEHDGADSGNGTAVKGS
jgi:MFS transporter, ACS family, pantothenate transporter